MTPVVPWPITDPVVLVASRCLLSLQQPKRCAKLHVLPHCYHPFFVLVSPCRLSHVRKDLLPRLQVHLQLLLDHLVGYFYGLVLGGLTISDGVRDGAWVLGL
jgi:hypothetical protein